MDDNQKEKMELWRLRIEEFDRNYFSLRDIEWRAVLEVLGGYAAISIAHFNLYERFGDTPLLLAGGLVLPLLLFAVYLYLSLEIQRRLHYTRDSRNRYVKDLHKLSGFDSLEQEKDQPMGAYWYAFRAQLVIHFAAVAAITVYVCSVHKWG